MKKYTILFMLLIGFFISINLSFAVTTSQDNICYYDVDSNEEIGCYDSDTQLSVSVPYNLVGKWQNTEDYGLVGWNSVSYSVLPSRSKIGYRTPTTASTIGLSDPSVWYNKDLYGDICSVDINSYSSNSLSIYSSLKPYPVTSLPDSFLSTSHYMKTRVQAQLFDATSNEPLDLILYPTETTSDAQDYTNYVLVKPDTNQFTFDLPTNQYIYDTFGPGNYYWDFTAEPIDMKCDFNLNGSLDSSEIASNDYQSEPFEVLGGPHADDDGDGIPNSQDNEPLNAGPEIYKGSPYLYTKVNCVNQGGETISFDEQTGIISSSSTEHTDLQGPHTLFKSNDKSRNLHELNDGSGRYQFIETNGDFLPDDDIGYCDIRYNGPENTGIYTDVTFPQKDIVENKDDTIRKFRLNLSTNEICFIEKDGTCSNIYIPPTDTSKSIKIIKNGINIKNQTIRPEFLALQAHKIRKFDNINEAKDFVQKSYNLMTSLNITKDINNQSAGITKIKLKLQIPQSKRVNLTVYQVISKEITNYNQINFIDNSGSQIIINDKDPVIGWYFNESDGDEEIEFEVPGDNEAGAVIITQEPILYNEGELIVNYREENCEPSEAQLFELDDLIESKLYQSGSGKLYKVCLAHETLPLYANSNYLTQHIFNFTHESNLSFTQPLDEPVDVSVNPPVNPPVDLYWDMKIQKENPTGDYSCLGSVDNLTSSLFGDCGYTTKRIWLHLGEDNTPPTTTHEYPTIAHKIKITLNAQDNTGGSGVDSTYYCIESDFNDCTNTATYTKYEDPFFMTCPRDWGCKKNLHYYSQDNANNIEPVNTHEILLIDKGSSCASDCTAKPKPNRYLKECSNLNGCKYYQYNKTGQYDNGDYVANQCHFLIENSWADFNSTHEIRCPNGPFRQKSFTQKNIEITNNGCSNIMRQPYNVLINGESVTMYIISCIP
jgi:hypothetical protein